MPNPQRRDPSALAAAFYRWGTEVSVHELVDVAGANERERRILTALGGVVAAVAGDHVDGWPDPLYRWADRAPEPPSELVEAVCEGLGSHSDPLSLLYEVSICSEHRRRLGTVFTPAPLVDHMLDLAATALDEPPSCILDPGAGVGAFTIAAARRWPSARVVAIDVNVVTLGLLAARIAFEMDAEPHDASTLGRIELVLADYLASLEEQFERIGDGRILTLGNPPYTRVQELPVSYRQKALSYCGDMIETGHANLAVLFQAATLRYMRACDVSCMVLPGSIGFTRASRGLRRALWTSRRPVTMQRTPATTRPFAGRAVQAAILMVGSEKNRRPPIHLARVEVNDGSVVVVEEWKRSRNEGEPDNWFWTIDAKAASNSVPLAQIARVGRGIATGASNMFFLTDAVASQLPREVVTPAVPTLRRFTGTELDKKAHKAWGDEQTKRWLLAIPPDFAIEGQLQVYLKEFEAAVSRRYLPSQRKPWYSITSLPRPHLLVAALSNKRFKVVANSMCAVPSNNLLGITMLNGGDPRPLAAWLLSDVGQQALRHVSRRYHGGSHKLEPGDLQRLRVPAKL